MDLDWCIKPEVGLPRPDAVLYLNLSAEEAAKRAEFGGERYEQTDFQKTVAINYDELWDNSYWQVSAIYFTPVLLNCFNSIFLHLKLELLMNFQLQMTKNMTIYEK